MISAALWASLATAAATVGAVLDGAPASGGAAAWTSFQGCAAPGRPSGREFFLDPVNGSVGASGSAQHPWGALTDTMRSHGSDLRSGDTLVLLSGDHGSTRLSALNSGFITLRAAPGATPIVQRLAITGGKWALIGVTFRDDHPGPLVSVANGAQDILIEGASFRSADDAATWSPDELAQRGAMGIQLDGRGGTGCITVRDSTLRFLDTGAKLMADRTVFAGNTIDRFGGDAIDYHGSNLLIAHNVITNAREVATDEHIDAIQGFNPGGEGWDPKPNARVTIDGNLVIRQLDPQLAYPVYMQGIDAFDGDWVDLTVVNNVVITNAYHGLFFSSVHGGVIANNTVLSDEKTTVNHPPHAKEPVVLTGRLVWIGVGDRTHQGRSSAKVVLRNNIAHTLHLVAAPGAVAADHNLIAPSVGRTFVDFNPKAFHFDVRPKAGGPAIGSGARDKAPERDITGSPRGPRVDQGAYAYAGKP